jgi:signal transduction histidine kinase
MSLHPLLVLSPYPTIDVEGNLYDGSPHKQPKHCQTRCKDHVCRAYSASNSQLSYFTCPHGFSVLTGAAGNLIVRINGVLETATNSSSAENKKRIKEFKVKASHIEEWLNSLSKAIPQYEEQLARQAVESVRALHDIKHLIGTLLSTTEQWIHEQPGGSFDDKLFHAPPALSTIHHSCLILQHLMEFTDLIANPAVARFGQPTPRSTHGLVLMLKRIYAANAAKRQIEINLEGESYNRPYVYSSIAILIFVLLDNAIKHSLPNSEVVIRFKDLASGGIDLDVVSFGPIVPKEKIDRIFEKGERANNTRARGSGLGLYVAKLVAEVHGIDIKYWNASVYLGKGDNHFSFTIPPRPPPPG